MVLRLYSSKSTPSRWFSSPMIPSIASASLPSVARVRHGHAGEAADELLHQALVVRGEMLHHDERHAGVERNRSEKALERLEPTGRSPDSRDEFELLLLHAPSASRRMM